MRIALITDGISPYVLGGMQKHSYYLAKYFAKNAVYVDLIHYNDSMYDIHALEVFNDEEKKYIKSIVLQFPTSFKFPGHYLYKSFKYSIDAYEAIKPNLSTYDFIYAKGFTGWKIISEKTKGLINCKIGVNFHGYEMFQTAPNFKSRLQQILMRPFVKRLSLGADVVFSYGGKITEIIRSIGVKSDRILEIPSGVESKYISHYISHHSDSFKKFVFLGRPERRKGIIELNVVIQGLISDNTRFVIEFIGPIPESMKIVNKRVVYHGEIRDFQKIKEILLKSDVLICPSWSEGFPNVILEAMASGLAIIATNVGAVSTMVSNRNGWLIEPGNKKELKNSLIEAMDSNDLPAKKEASLKLVQTQFNWEVISEYTLNTIQGLIR